MLNQSAIKVCHLCNHFNTIRKVTDRGTDGRTSRVGEVHLHAWEGLATTYSPRRWKVGLGSGIGLYVDFRFSRNSTVVSIGYHWNKSTRLLTTIGSM